MGHGAGRNVLPLAPYQKTSLDLCTSSARLPRIVTDSRPHEDEYLVLLLVAAVCGEEGWVRKCRAWVPFCWVGCSAVAPVLGSLTSSPSSFHL